MALFRKGKDTKKTDSAPSNAPTVTVRKDWRVGALRVRLEDGDVSIYCAGVPYGCVFLRTSDAAALADVLQQAVQ